MIYVVNIEVWYRSSILIYRIYMYVFILSWKIIFVIKGELIVS